MKDTNCETTSSLLVGYDEWIPTERIVYLQSARNYTVIYTAQRKRFVSCKTLLILQNLLSGTPFIRISRGLLINPSYIVSHCLGSKRLEVVLSNGTRLMAARRRIKACLPQLLNQSNS